MSSLDFVVSVLERATRDCTKVLNLCGKELTTDDANQIATWLRTNTTLKKLNLSDNFFGDEGLGAFVDAIRENTTLQKLDLSYNTIREPLRVEGSKAVLTALVINTGLISFKMDGTRLTGCVFADPLSRIIRENKTLKKLHLETCRIHSETKKAIGNALAENSTLTKLYIGGNGTKCEDFEILFETLKTNTTLCTLGLQNSGVEDADVKYILPLLRKESPLCSLDLSNNHIGSEGVLMIMNAMYNGCCLEKLYLDHNSILTPGARHIAAFLMRTSSLEVLSLKYCGIGIDGIIALGGAWNHGAKMRIILLGGNAVSWEELERMKKLISACETTPNRQIVL